MKIKLPLLFFLVLIVGSFVTQLCSGVSYAQATPIPADAQAGWVLDQEVTFVGKTATRANEFLEWALSKENYRWITLSTTPGADNPIQSFWIIVRNIVFILLALFVLGAAFVMIVTRGQNLTVMRFIPRFIMIVILVVLSFALIRFIYQAVDVVQGFFLNIKDPVTGANRNISPEDLLYIAFHYETFEGFRKVGIKYDESAFISLLLVKLTAITYYVMTGLLLIRKIILWFFIIVSPIFPLLLFFRPVRNTAKIWVGEFFRWLLYAPLFALFLHGLVNVWRSGIPMSFDFSKVGTEVYPTAINILLGGPGQQLDYYNSVNIRDTFALYVVALLMLWVVILLPFLLLQIFLDYLNNVTISENPVIKKITSNSWFNKAYGGTPPPSYPGQPPTQPAPFGLAKSIPFFNKRTMETPAARGATMSQVNSRTSNVYSTNQVNTNSRVTSNRSTIAGTNTNTNTIERTTLNNTQSVRETNDVLKLANLSVPKMKDIARYETSMLKHDTVSRTEVNRFHETLEKISKPTIVVAPHDRETFTTIKEKLIASQKQGDPLATSVLNATQASTKSTQVVKENSVSTITQVLKGISSPEVITNPEQRTNVIQIKQTLEAEKAKGNTLATTILEAAEKYNSTTTSEEEKKTIVEKSVETIHEQEKRGNKLATSIIASQQSKADQIHLPATNQVQQVSIEEYEDVKKMWQENYNNMETPIGPSGAPIDKKTFISQDVDNITETINLLSSQSQENVDRGMERVANILPFLLLGGFSKTEVISYLKAKLEAGKSVISGVDAAKEDEDSLVERTPERKSEHAKLSMHQELPVEEETSQDAMSGLKPMLDAEKNEGSNEPGGAPPSKPV